jgi:aminoglycoside phosphotransferase (APT) family kinase protein
VRFRAFAPHTRLGLPVVVQEYQAGENAAQALQRGAAQIGEVASALGAWVGTLHGVRRARSGSVIGASGDADWATTVASRVRTALAAVVDEAVPRARVASEFERAISDLPDTGPASLVHGDLYLDNVLVEDGHASALIDFEHAHFHDRFADFGKLEELLFEHWPGSERPFMEAYAHHFPHDDADAMRRRVGVGLYELSQLAYFSRWQPDLVDVYRTRLDRWVTRR